ncbi:ATP-binding protein [Diaminobutyricimonas sp. LJ205]|uniref:AAA family ATPase n=1 Tax=Diaminobutyricimonas sp. LJ205 TaxID=2683590 RepID=UPI0018E06169|nr:ATP-binding protein [Diaminobutyricimonas sp. LJ205]
MDDSNPPTVVMMCGVAGSGKTTYATGLEQQGFVRLSIDEAIWAAIGKDGAELEPAEYEEHKAAAERVLESELLRLIADGRSAVLDYSFWQKATRDRYKALIEQGGGQWELVYLRVPASTLRRRLAARNELTGANAVTVSEELLDRYLTGFEAPRGEGERIIEQA